LSRTLSKEEYDAFRHFLEETSGILLGENKHYLVSSRLGRLMEEHKLDTFTDLVNCLKKSSVPGIKDKVVNAMTTNETMWFRDVYPYELLKSQILPEFAKRRDKPLRIWSSACSTGQEPYSMSIIVQEFLQANPGSYPAGVQIVATDISSRVLDYAKAGHYDDGEISRGMEASRRDRFFTNADDRWQVRPEIKSRIQFKQMNLQNSYTALGEFDVIFCRNVLIYFSSELKTDILERMSSQLNSSGYLVLGGSEAPNRYTAKYAMQRLPQGVVYKCA
jgi:chemotaxis protein methyltransferase CheR